MANGLFDGIRIGKIQLAHRLVMAPLTRFRSDLDHVPLDFVKTYYEQRATVPGTLIIAEATYVSPQAVGENNIPGIWTKAQIEGWKPVTSAVHAKGSYIFMQLFAAGRSASLTKPDFDVVSSSAIRQGEECATPRELREEEIWQLVADFAQAAKNAVEAGFDGVEIHGANGYLVDQFVQDVANKRTDAWGGSVEKRSRFALEVTKAVTQAVGSDRVGVRLSPWSDFQGMRMEDPVPTFLHLVTELRKLKIAYLHLVEPRIAGGKDADTDGDNSAFVNAWERQSPIFLAGGFTPETAKAAVEERYPNDDVAVVIGRHFTSNPDLVYRVQKGLPLADYDRDTFYKVGSPEGYVTHGFSEDYRREFPDRVKSAA